MSKVIFIRKSGVQKFFLIPLLLTSLFIILFSNTLHSQNITRITKSYFVEDASLNDVKASIQGLLSPKGNIIVVDKQKKLIVQDYADNMDLVESLMKEINAPKPNVRVEVTMTEITSETDRDFDLNVRKRKLTVRDLNSGADSLNSQFLMVRSGGSATIQIGEEIPFNDYFWNYASGLGLIGTIETRWRSIGSRLSIKPTVSGKWITVEVTPEISALVDAKNEIIRFRNLATTVTVEDGGSVPIGGFDGANDEFNRSFFHRGRNKTTRVGQVTLKASLQ